jgi:hypothetical protein
MVYVDDMFRISLGQFGRMKMSHMIADSQKELLAMAIKIGVNTKWIQNKGTPREHFDICMAKRKLAVQFGAKEIPMREMGEMILKRKRHV